MLDGGATKLLLWAARAESESRDCVAAEVESLRLSRFRRSRRRLLRLLLLLRFRRRSSRLLSLLLELSSLSSLLLLLLESESEPLLLRDRPRLRLLRFDER
jgi:hypothetical protein